MIYGVISQNPKSLSICGCNIIDNFITIIFIRYNYIYVNENSFINQYHKNIYECF